MMLSVSAHVTLGSQTTASLCFLLFVCLQDYAGKVLVAWTKTEQGPICFKYFMSECTWDLPFTSVDCQLSVSLHLRLADGQS